LPFRLCRVRTSGKPAEGPLPDMRREGWRGQIWFAASHGCGAVGLVEADVLVDTAGVACGTCRPQRRGSLCFSRPLSPSRRSSAKRTSGRARRALPLRHGPKVMLRPRTENLANRCQSNLASPSDAIAASAASAGSALCHALNSRTHQAHPFNHSQAGFRSRRLAPSMWRATAAARQPAIKRLVNAQQNARRCDPSGGDPGGCSARPPCRGIRLRVRQP
jgi:hypothetical protein